MKKTDNNLPKAQQAVVDKYPHLFNAAVKHVQEIAQDGSPDLDGERLTAHAMSVIKKQFTGARTGERRSIPLWYSHAPQAMEKLMLAKATAATVAEQYNLV